MDQDSIAVGAIQTLNKKQKKVPIPKSPCSKTRKNRRIKTDEGVQVNNENVGHYE